MNKNTQNQKVINKDLAKIDSVKLNTLIELSELECVMVAGGSVRVASELASMV
jgi:hypothetical protein